MDKIFLFILCFYHCSAQIKINKLDVPPAILYGSQNDVVLDCDFDSGGDEVEEVKWFIDGDHQIYQWLPTANRKAQAIGKLKNHIDVNYKATNDAKTMYRALHITDLSPEFSGNYTCKVSSLNSEDVETKRMIIYATPDDFAEDDDEDEEILELTISEDTSEIVCSSGGYFPQPNMTLYIVNDNETEILFLQDDEIVTLTDDGLYNVTSVLKFDTSNLSQSFHYTCELAIPGTPYNISETWMHIQEDSSEMQVEEELFNESNSTESSFEEAAETETQIEEENFITTESDVTKEETDNLEESASFKPLPSLLSTVLALALLSPLYL